MLLPRMSLIRRTAMVCLLSLAAALLSGCGNASPAPDITSDAPLSSEEEEVVSIDGRRDLTLRIAVDDQTLAPIQDILGECTPDRLACDNGSVRELRFEVEAVETPSQARESIPYDLFLIDSENVSAYANALSIYSMPNGIQEKFGDKGVLYRNACWGFEPAPGKCLVLSASTLDPEYAMSTMEYLFDNMP